MNLMSSFMNIILRTKEKLGFKLSEKEDLLILIDDVNKVTSMLLRMERVKEKMKMRRIKPNVEHDPDIDNEFKSQIKLDQSDENIRLYIR